MNTNTIIISGIAFLVAGIVFCLVAIKLKSIKDAESIKVCKPAGTIFYIIGSLTFVFGLLVLVFNKEFSVLAFRISFLVYLVILSIIFFVFVSLIKDETKK